MRKVLYKKLMRLIAQLMITAFFCFSPSFAAEKGSLYDLPLNWTNQSGKEFKLENLRGKPVILTLAYTKCKTACPLTMQRLKKIEQELESKVKDPHFVVISLDPETDTPKKMAEFEKQYKLDGKRWHLLTGSPSDVRRFSVLLSYSYQKVPETSLKENPDKDEIVHSNKILALNENGEIASILEGLSSEIKPFVAEIEKL